MPLTRKGQKILAHMTETHKSPKKAKQVFYASRNAGRITGVEPKSHMPKGVTQSPMGDLGQHRGVEAKIAGGGFKGAKITSASRYFTKGR